MATKVKPNQGSKVRDEKKKPTAKVGGMQAARRRAKEMFHKHGSEFGGRARYNNLRLKWPEKPIRMHLQRPSVPYQDPENREEYFWWKVGMGRFLKTQKYKRGIFVEANLSGPDLLDAYASPKQFQLENEEGVGEGKWIAKFKKKPYWCVSGWVEEWFHLVEFEDKGRKDEKGNPRTWIERVLCTGKSCEVHDFPKVFGNRFWVDFSYAQWFGEIERVYEKLSRLPKDGGYVYPVHYACEECKEVLRFTDRSSGEEVAMNMTDRCGSCGADGDKVQLDMGEHLAVCSECEQQWPLLSHEDNTLREYLNSVHKCNGCGHEGYPLEVLAHSEGKEKWECYDIYDVQLSMYKAAEGERGRVVVKGFKLQEPDARLFDAEMQGGGEIGGKIAERHKEPLDLNKIHEALSPAEQADIVDLPNLFDSTRSSKKQNKVRFKPRGERSDDDESEKAEKAEETEQEEE